MSLHRFTRACSSGRLFILLVLFQLVSCGSGTGTSDQFPSLSWIAPSEREDGTPIALSEIAGYRIYYGTSNGEYPFRLDITDSTAERTGLDSLFPGDYVFVITTLDTDGRESAFSKEVSVSIPNGI